MSVTILVSAVVSLTLTPMMCSKILRHQKESEKSWFYRASENSLNWIIDQYAAILRFVLKHQPATLVVTVGTLALTIFLFLVIPKGFFPVQDTGVILGISEAPATLSFPAMAERQQALAKVILKDPDVVSLSSFIGVDGVNMLPNSGRIQINLKSREERTDDAPADYSPPAGEPDRREGNHSLLAARAGPDRGRPHQPHAVPVHDGRRGRAASLPSGRRN